MFMAEKIEIRPATITIKQNKVLLVKSKYGGEEFYLFPGGGLESGETLEEGAIRETFEETGIKVKIKELVHVNEYIYKKDWNKRSIASFFLTEQVGEGKINIQTIDDGKIKEVVWVGIEKLDKLDVKPKILIKSIKDYVKKKIPFPKYSVDYKE